MDLRGIANAVSNTVNPNVTVSVTRSTGYTIGAGGKQQPTYAAPLTGAAQIQALDNGSLQKLSGLNIQSDVKTIIFRGDLAGVVRPNSKGGDIVTIAPPAPSIYVGTWLVVKVLESWPNWTKAAIVLQSN